MPDNGICVFGTSNGLFKDGYVAGISDIVGVERTKNCSVGASSSFVWFATRALIDPEQFDWAILDYCVNDGLMIRDGSNTEANWRGSLAASIEALRARSCQPVLLILPGLPALKGANPLRDIALSLAEEYALPYLDGYALVADIVSGQPTLPVASLFRDPPHLHPDISRLIGQAVATALNELPAPGDFGKAPTSPVRYTFTQLDDWLPDQPVVERATSLTSRKFVNIGKDSPLTIPVAQGQRVVGLAFDLAKTHGAIKVSGDRQWIKSWTNTYYTQWLGVERAMVFSVLPIAGKVGPSDGLIRIEALDDDAAEIDETYGRPSGDAAPAYEPNFAFSGVLLAEDAPAVPITRPFAKAPNLLDIIGPDLAVKIGDLAMTKQAEATA